MTKVYLYTYLGTNGTLQTPILLEGVPHTTLVRLVAEKNSGLTKDNTHYVTSIAVPEEDVELWKEVNFSTGQ